MISTKDNRGPQADDGSRDPSGGDRAASDATGASIEKVRDILFGQQVREFERRFTRLEDRILKETVDLKEELIARVAALEAFTKREIESLAEQIKLEHDHRVDSHSSIARELKDAASALERRTSALDDALSKNQREIRQQILDQNQHLSDDIRRKTDEVLETLARQAQELRNDKADRATIAALLTEMAVRLTDDFPISGEDARNG